MNEEMLEFVARRVCQADGKDPNERVTMDDHELGENRAWFGEQWRNYVPATKRAIATHQAIAEFERKADA
jgi:hypothetical protein